MNSYRNEDCNIDQWLTRNWIVYRFVHFAKLMWVSIRRKKQLKPRAMSQAEQSPRSLFWSPLIASWQYSNQLFLIACKNAHINWSTCINKRPQQIVVGNAKYLSLEYLPDPSKSTGKSIRIFVIVLLTHVHNTQCTLPYILVTQPYACAVKKKEKLAHCSYTAGSAHACGLFRYLAYTRV